jgi:hypothetical protein
MTYSELVTTDDLAESVPTKINENFRKARFLNTSAQTATFTVFADDATGSPKDIYLVTTGSSAVSANLPAAGSDYTGRVVTIFKADAGGGAVTIDGNASETINGATTVALSSQYHYRTIMCDGSNWIVLSSS